MTPSQKNKAGYALVELYELLYTDTYKKAPNVNRFKEHYNMMVVMDQFGFDGAKELLEYYFKTPRAGHPINEFMNNYHILWENKNRAAREAARRAKIRQETKERVEDVQQQRTEGN